MFSSNATQVSAAAGPNYIEDVFSTYLYTGNGAAQSIINNIQLGAGATSPGWILNTGSASSDAAQGIALDASGNIYVTGYSPFNKCLLIKYDSSGVVQWQRTLQVPAGGSTSVGSSVKTDSSGNVYIAGYFDDNVGNIRLLIVKYNSSGTLQWQRQLNAASADYGFGIAVDTSANVYVTGYTTVSTRTGCILAKYNSSGTIQWQRQLGGTVTSETGRSVDVDSSGNVYIAGNSSTSILIAKYNSSGVIQWQRTLGTGGAIAYGIAIDSSANIYITGNSAGATAFVVKYNTSGTLQWQRQLSPGSLSSTSIALDSSANVYSIGYFASGSAAFIAKYNTSGTFQWVRQLSGGTTNTGTAITSSSSGNLYAAGVIDNNIFVASLPNDGSGIGSYTLGSSTVTYAVAPLSDSLLSLTGATSTLTDAAASLTDSASSCTDAASSLTTSSVSLFTGSGYGGLVWLKGRSGATDHALYDTARGATFDLVSNSTAAQTTQTTGLTSFDGGGFSIGALAKLNTNAATYASWTFRKQAKFFDVVTWTGNGTLPRVIPHNLGSVPGCIIAKRTDIAADWYVYHRSLNGGSVPEFYWLLLNSTVATQGSGSIWGTIAPTSTGFNVGATLNTLPGSGITPTYVAYVFAHDAGGFGAAGTDNVISCGSYTGTGTSGNFVSLGYEPQWLLIKRTDTAPYNWFLFDNMRGIVTGSGNDLYLNPNLSDAEGSSSQVVAASATGFTLEGPATGINASGGTYIYIAIRRGPMKTPTSGTSVFSPIASSAATGTALTTGFPVDMQIFSLRTGTTNKGQTVDRLRGVSSTTTESGAQLITNSTAAETTTSIPTRAWNNTGFQMPSSYGGTSEIFWNFGRAPGFFDVVCYTGDGVSSRSVTHNLSAVPELYILKSRSSGAQGEWWVYTSSTGQNSQLRLMTNFQAAAAGNVFGATAPTASVFYCGSGSNFSGQNYVAYLFTTCPGVSKVGSYTGSGTTKQIDCGFTGGARFVLIKRTDSTGDWYVWDSARGIVAGNDPYLLLNSTAAEVTSTDYVDTYSAGFEISSTAPAAINANGGSFIFLAIA